MIQTLKKMPYGTFLMSIGGASLVFLFIARVIVAISFSEPRHVVTSGCEEESLFAMWKWMHHWPVYSDPHQIPFAASYFNWLFYAIYGSIMTFVMKGLHLPEVWLPTVGRCITLAVISMGCWVNYRLFSALPIFIALSLSLLLWFGPLIGYWGMTVRPDVIGLFFDLLAVYCFLKYLPTRPVLAILLTALGCYLSWACKQVNIVMPIAIGLSLLWDRRWGLVLLFSTSLSAAYAVTLLLANPIMLKALFFVSTAVPLSLDVLQSNLVIFIKKSLPAWFLLGVMLFARQVSTAPMARLGWCGLIAWACVLLPASSKVGSADNYHFIALLFLLLIVAASLETALKNKWALSQKVMAFSGVLLVMITTVAFTNGSRQHLQEQHEATLAFSAQVAKAKPPLFIINPYMALPWMHTSPVSFILSFNYGYDRAQGEPFEKNGIGGLIKTGYFHTLILPETTENSFDEASLEDYIQSSEPILSGYKMYIKRDAV